MPELLNDEKTFDSTITKIAFIFQNEFHPTLPPFITLVNHETQCFHYYGKQYYNKLISDHVEMKERIPEVIKKVINIINRPVPNIKKWYEKCLTERTLNYLKNNSISINDDDYIDCFLDLLLNTPISLSYGIVGQAYYTRLPRFFYTEDMFNNYSGVKKSFTGDQILGSDRDTFHEIINTLEEIFWKGFNVKSTIYAPISLYGQIAGVAFVSDPEENKFDYDKYLRFLQLKKELSITLIKDAKEYEFLSAVLKELPNKFKVIESLFRWLPVIFNITGACLQYEDEEKASRLLFCKQDTADFPQWSVDPCVSCNQFKSFDGKNVIPSDSLCNKSTSGALQPKYALKLTREMEGRSFGLLLYYDIEPLPNDYKSLINLELDDVLKLLILEKENEEKIRKIELQSHLLSNFPHITLKYIIRNLEDDITQEEKNYTIDFIRERGFYLKAIANAKNMEGEPKLINICEEINMFTKYNLFRKTDETIWGTTDWNGLFKTDCDSCEYKSLGRNIVGPQYGKGALYTIFENILNNAIGDESGNTIIDRRKGGRRTLKEAFKVHIQCVINQYFVFKIGDTTSLFKANDGKKYFKSDPLIVDKNDKGLGLYSIYTAGSFLSTDKKPELTFSNESCMGCIDGCGYTYIFHFQVENQTGEIPNL